MKFFLNSMILHLTLIGLILSHDILFSVENSISNTSKSIKQDVKYKENEIYNEALYSIAITEDELNAEIQQLSFDQQQEKEKLKKEALQQIEIEKNELLKKLEADKQNVSEKEKEIQEKELKLKEEEQKLLQTKEDINKSENALYEQKIVVQNEKNNAEELLNYIEYEKNKLNDKFNQQNKEIEDKNRALIEKNQIILKREQEINELKSKLQSFVVTNNKKNDSIYKNDNELKKETAIHIENIKQRILQNWKYEEEYKGVSCKITLKQDYKGYILKIHFNECYNDIGFQNSIRKAIFASNPLPLPKNKEIFEENVSLFFKIH